MNDAWQGILSEMADPRQTASQVDSFATTFQDTMIAAVQNVRQNFGQMWMDFATGAKSAGDSIRDFVKGFLQAILQAVTNRMVQQFLNLLMDFIPGGGGTNFTSVGMSAAGGEVQSRAEGGFINGNVPGRDSVLKTFRPGDFIMRQSAVQMMGRKHLDGINGYRQGGRVRARVMPGEYAINRDSARAFGVNNLKHLNWMGNTYDGGLMAAGGSLMDELSSRMGHDTHSATDPFGNRLKSPKDKKNHVTNVWITTPEERPQLGPNDVIAVITNDMLRNGATKKLVKSIAAGN
jgi:hypothetical protein